MIYENKLVSSSGDEPITSAYVKNYLRVDFDTDDAIITALITAARQVVEKYIEQALITKNFKCYFSQFEDWDVNGGLIYLELPISPVTAITAVSSVDEDGTETAITDYKTTGLDIKTVRVNQTFTLTGGATSGYVVEYTALNSSIDEPIKDAIAKLVGEMYENRQESGVDISVSMMPFDVRAMLTNYRKTFI
ncbi:MAG: head-tail connector protein [Croceimicrobium sp.]